MKTVGGITITVKGHDKAAPVLERIEHLRQLGVMSTTIGRLSDRTVRARTAYESNVMTSNRQKREHALSARWEKCRAELQTAYDESVAFSTQHGITVLPVPEGLRQ